MTDDFSWLVKQPIAHRGYHDPSSKIYENTISAWKSTIDAGFIIECDLQISADGKAMVFHDADLARITDQSGPLRHRTAAELATIRILDSSDTIRTLDEHLEEAAGKVPLLIELKGIAGEDNGLTKSVAKSLKNYKGQAALMSFNHWLVEQFVEAIPGRPHGLTAMGNDNCYDFHMNVVKGNDLHFVSYRIHDIPCRFTEDMRKQGKSVITWTVRNREECILTHEHADQITFDGFDPREICK